MADRHEFYGDRAAGGEHPSGKPWRLGSHVEDVDDDEVDQRERRFRQQRTAP